MKTTNNPQKFQLLVESLKTVFSFKSRGFKSIRGLENVENNESSSIYVLNL